MRQVSPDRLEFERSSMPRTAALSRESSAAVAAPGAGDDSDNDVGLYTRRVLL